MSETIHCLLLNKSSEVFQTREMEIIYGKESRAKIEHLQTTGDTDPVRLKRYMETEMVYLPTVQSVKCL